MSNFQNWLDKRDKEQNEGFFGDIANATKTAAQNFGKAPTTGFGRWVNNALHPDREQLLDPDAINFPAGSEKFKRAFALFTRYLHQHGVVLNGPGTAAALDEMILAALNGKELNYDLVEPAMRRFQADKSVPDEIKQDYSSVKMFLSVLDSIIKNTPDLWWSRDYKQVYPNGINSIRLPADINSRIEQSSRSDDPVIATAIDTAVEYINKELGERDRACFHHWDYTKRLALAYAKKHNVDIGDLDELLAYDNPKLGPGSCPTHNTAVDIVNSELDRDDKKGKYDFKSLVALAHKTASQERARLGDVKDLHAKSTTPPTPPAPPTPGTKTVAEQLAKFLKGDPGDPKKPNRECQHDLTDLTNRANKYLAYFPGTPMGDLNALLHSGHPTCIARKGP